MSLPEFRTVNVCPKCGAHGPKLEYHPPADRYDLEKGRGFCMYHDPAHFDEHIHLICQNCGYRGPWAMKVVSDSGRPQAPTRGPLFMSQPETDEDVFGPQAPTDPPR